MVKAKDVRLTPEETKKVVDETMAFARSHPYGDLLYELRGMSHEIFRPRFLRSEELQKEFLIRQLRMETLMGARYSVHQRQDHIIVEVIEILTRSDE